MEQLRPWRYPKGTRLLHNGTGLFYTVSSECRRFENGKYGYIVKGVSGSQDRITLDEIILKGKYCLAG